MQIEWTHEVIHGVFITAFGAPTLWAVTKIYFALKEHRPHTHGEADPQEKSAPDRPLLVRGIRFPKEL